MSCKVPEAALALVTLLTVVASKAATAKPTE
ncbi:unannotated protein [freshwater metagenome]|uniref:Unannotated protein n=1 Tax=freshwater metagenome TaxID=449393 RepID=A0A6J6MEY3_9ZZZZ